MKQINIAVLGTGDWGQNLIRNFAQLANLVGVCDINTELAKKVAFQYQVPSFTWQEILANQTIDAVVIANSRSHYKFAKEALSAHKHVFVEKPLAPTVAQAKDLCLIAKQVNKKLMVGHLLNYHPAFIYLKKLCKENFLGDLRYVYSRRLAFGKFMPEEDVIMSLASHDISMILALIGRPKSLTAFAENFLIKQIPDQATLHLKFAEKQHGHIVVSWFHPIKEQRLVVIGSRAMAVFDDLLPWDQKLCIYHHQVDLSREVAFLNRLVPEYINIIDRSEPLYYEAKHFLDCIVYDLEPYTSGIEGVEVLRVVEQAIRQLKSSQKKVSINSI